MATIAFSVLGAGAGGAAFPGLSLFAGAVTGATIGQAVGGLIGSYFDSTFLFPAIFSPESNEFSGPTLDQIQLQGSTEGDPINFCIGLENRVAGTVMYLSDLITETVETEGGSKGGGGGRNRRKVYFVNVAIGVCEGEVEDIDKIWANGKVIYDRGQEDGRYESITIYKGTYNQTADSVITSDPNVVTSVPATPTQIFVNGFPGLAYVVIEKLALDDFGNTLPQFNFLVRESNDGTIQHAIKQIVKRAGRDITTELDVTRVDGCIQGYSTNGAQEPIRTLAPIISAFNLAVTQRDGVMTMFKRGTEETVTVPADHLSTTLGGRQEPLRVTDPFTFELPTEINLQYIDPGLDYQRGSQRERLASQSSAVNSVDMQVPFTLQAPQARLIAKRVLWLAHHERRNVRFNLPPTYMNVKEGDVIVSTLPGTSIPIRIRALSLTSGANGLIEGKGVLEDAFGFEQNVTIDASERRPAGPYIPRPLEYQVFEAPALREDLVNKFGLYVAASRRYASDQFGGGALFRSSTQTGTFRQKIDITSETTMGYVEGVLPTFMGNARFTDDEITVKLTGGASLSTTSFENWLLDGSVNRAMIGQELIGFLEVTSLGDDRYTLSKICRGLRLTDPSTLIHYAGEPFVLVGNGESIAFYEEGNGSINRRRWYKVVAVEDDPDNILPKPVDLTGVGQQVPEPVIDEVISRRFDDAGTEKIDLFWYRRSRTPFTQIISPAPEDDGSAYQPMIFNQTRNEWQPLVTIATPAEDEDPLRYWQITESKWTSRGYTSSTDKIIVGVRQRGLRGPGPIAATSFDPL